MSPARLPNGNGATMTQAPTPTADTVRRLVLSLLNDAKAGKNGKDSKASEGSNEASKAATGTEDAQGGRRGEEPRPGGSTPGPDVRPATPGAQPMGHAYYALYRLAMGRGAPRCSARLR